MFKLDIPKPQGFNESGLQLNLPPGRALFWMGLGFTILAGVRLV
jgi:hypothetical protein